MVVSCCALSTSHPAGRWTSPLCRNGHGSTGSDATTRASSRRWKVSETPPPGGFTGPATGRSTCAARFPVIPNEDWGIFRGGLKTEIRWNQLRCQLFCSRFWQWRCRSFDVSTHCLKENSLRFCYEQETEAHHEYLNISQLPVWMNHTIQAVPRISAWSVGKPLVELSVDRKQNGTEPPQTFGFTSVQSSNSTPFSCPLFTASCAGRCPCAVRLDLPIDAGKLSDWLARL